MNLLDVIGPVMVGPSSSHTAGAARIGLVSRKLMGEPVADARILFHGSFLDTGKGHGTDRALVAGLLGYDVDDARIPDSFTWAEKNGLSLTFGAIDLGEEAHPNTVQLFLKGRSGRDLELVACSVGGGQIEIREIDGLKAVFSGSHPTLIVQNDDTPGEIAEITMTLASHMINIATVQLTRDARGGLGVAVIEVDQEIPEQALYWLKRQQGILKVTYLSLRDEVKADGQNQGGAKEMI